MAPETQDLVAPFATGLYIVDDEKTCEVDDGDDDDKGDVLGTDGGGRGRVAHADPDGRI